MLHINSFRFTLILTFLATCFISAQEPEKKGGLNGLFNGLKDAVKEVSPDASEIIEGNGKSLLDRAKDLSKSTLDKGKQSFDELLTDGIGSNSHMAELLSYLDKKLAGRKPAFTSQEVQAMAKELIPLVEELNDRKFNTPPKVAITGNLEMIKILGNDLIPQLTKQFPDASKPAIFIRSYINAGLFAPSLLGKYGVTDQTVYLLPENVKAAMTAGKIPSELAEDLMKIIIVHELTHALQDQEVNLNEAILNVENPDASLAFQALMEGHAVYIQNAAAKKLNLTEAAEAARYMLTAPELEDEAWLINNIAMADAIIWESIYLGGEKFINHHASKKGIEAIWTMMKDPPTRTSMIVKPETYTAKHSPIPNYQPLFANTPSQLKATKWKVSTHTMGDFNVQSQLGALPREQRESIMKQLNKSALLQFSAPMVSLRQGIEAVVFQFNEQTAAEQMLSAMNRLNSNNAKSANASSMVNVLEEKKINYNVDDSINGTAMRLQTEAMFIGKQTTNIIQVRKGNVVVQIAYSDVDLKRNDINDFLRSAVAKFQQ